MREKPRSTAGLRDLPIWTFLSSEIRIPTTMRGPQLLTIYDFMSRSLYDQVLSAQNSGTKPQGIAHCFLTVTLDLCHSLSIGFRT